MTNKSQQLRVRQIYMGGCQNYGPFLGILSIRCRIIIGIQKRDSNFDNTHMNRILVVAL